MKRFVLFASLFLIVLLASAYQILANPEVLNANLATPSASPSQVWAFESEFDAPRQVLENYYEALQEGNFKFAYLLWDQSGSASGSDLNTFSQRFQQLKNAKIIFSSTGEMGEAEGFRYFKQPVTLSIETKTGETKTFKGEYTLRQPAKNKVNETWHIYNVSYQQIGSTLNSFF